MTTRLPLHPRPRRGPRTPAPSTRRTLALLTWAAALLACALAAAQPDPIAPDPRYRVFLSGNIDGTIDFYPDPDESRKGTPQFDTDRLARAIERYFAQNDERFVVVPSGEFLEAFTRTDSDIRDAPDLARIMRSMRKGDSLLKKGVNALSRASLSEAEGHLLEAARLLEKVKADLLFPSDLAQVYEHLAIVYDEERSRDGESPDLAARQNDVLLKMIRLEPARVLVYPFYSDSLERAWRAARQDVLLSREAGADEPDRARARRSGALVNADIVLWGYAVQTGPSVTLTLHMLRRDTGEPLFFEPERITLSQDPDAQIERADRLASRFAACIEPLPTPRPQPADQEKGRFYLDSSFAYLAFLRTRPIDVFFNNFGFSLSGQYMLSENFALSSRINLMTGGVDANGHLREGFGSIRTFFGGTYALRIGIVRPFIGFSLEADRLAEFSMTTNFFCKINVNAPGCDPNDIIVQRPGWLVGVNSQIGASLRLYRELFMTASGNFAFYVLPLSDPAVDLPLGFDFGLQYRF